MELKTDSGVVGRLHLFKSVYRLGEEIIGTIDLSMATIPCLQVRVKFCLLNMYICTYMHNMHVDGMYMLNMHVDGMYMRNMHVDGMYVHAQHACGWYVHAQYVYRGYVHTLFLNWVELQSQRNDICWAADHITVVNKCTAVNTSVFITQCIRTTHCSGACL